MLNKILNNLKKYPDDECYQTKNNVYKNRDLYKYVCNIYSYITKKCSRQDRVIVYGHKEIYMIASFLACSFAGITYVPLDISIPYERKLNIIKQVKPKLILTSDIINEDSSEEITSVSIKDNDIYYIIFTSGSSGQPKGVQIMYKNLKSCMNWLIDICDINQTVILNQANFSFDLSVADIYLSLLTRSKHYIIEKELTEDFYLLFNALKISNAEFAVMTPSFADFLLIDKSFNKTLMPHLKKILFCGEVLSQNTVSKLYERFPYIKIINSYGPTECTFAVTSTVVTPNEKISIGTPKDDVSIYIVDKNLNRLNEGEIGEILIAGESVGNGYLDKSLNKNTFITYDNKRAYLTGDFAYWKDNKLYYIGRHDSQIKFKGYRIELLEIEQVINNLNYVQKSVVTTTKNKYGNINGIIAFVLLKDFAKDDTIKNDISNMLPKFMMPKIKIVEKIPLTPNGKVDIKLLLGELK